MNKLNLKDVTLFCIDDMAPIKAHAVMESVCNNIEFGDVKLFSSRSEECVTNKLEKPPSGSWRRGAAARRTSSRASVPTRVTTAR